MVILKDDKLKEELKKKDKRIQLLLDDVVSLEDYVHDLSNFSPLPVCFLNPSNIILEVNPALEELSGYNLNELVGSSVDKILSERDVTRINNETRKEDKVEGLEVSLTNKEKDIVPVQVFTRVRRGSGGEMVGYFLGLFDLSKMKETAGELKRSQTALLNILEDTEASRQQAEEERAKTQNIIENLSDGLVVLDKDNKVSFVNPMAESFLGIEREEVVERSLSSLEGKRVDKLVELVGNMGLDQEFSRLELHLEEDLVLEVSNVSMEEGCLLIFHDVTREKIVEKLKTEFVSVAAHQLRTPLSAVKWSLRMFLDGDVGNLEDYQRKLIDKTYQSNERMINLVNSLLNVARIEEGRFVYDPVILDLEDLVERVVDELRPSARQKEIRMVFRRPKKELSSIRVDREKIRIVVQNLLDNAIKYTLEGGSVTVFVEESEREGYVSFRVKDTGVGIPEGQKERVFSKFFRGENVVRMETVGTGLGLFIARNIIEAHDGQISFNSEKGEGTTFWFELPMVE